MPKKKATKSRKNTTKCRHSASGTRISRLFSALLALAVFKLGLVGAIALDIFPAAQPGGKAAAIARSIQIVSEAQAAKESRPAAATAVPAQEAKKPAPAQAAAPAPAVEKKPEPESLPQDWAALKSKQEELARREKALKNLESRIDAKLKRLTTLEGQIAQMLKDAGAIRDKKMKHLVDVYSNMKPKNAAQAIEKLDEETSVKILSGMRGRQAGEILNYVSPERAARLSQALTEMQVPFAQ